MVWFAVLEHVVALVVEQRVLVAAQLHLFDFSVLPPVHVERPHKGDVDAHIPVDRSAGVAQENSNVGGGPLGVLALTIETDLIIEELGAYFVFWEGDQLFENFISLFIRHES